MRACVHAFVCVVWYGEWCGMVSGVVWYGEWCGMVCGVVWCVVWYGVWCACVCINIF